MSTKSIGSIVGLWRYPVKSMQGEELNGSHVTERGLLGDRAYAIVERQTGHIASAKHPRKWSALFACRAAFVAPPQPNQPLPPVWITLPDGAVLRSDQPDVNQILSSVFDRDVALIAEAPAAPTREANRTPIDADPADEMIMQEPMAIAAPNGTFFDYATVHVLTTATLDRLRELYPAGRFEARRFRPNLVIAPTDADGFVETTWLGHTLNTTTGVQLHLIDPSPRCIVTTLPQGDLPRDPGILRTLAQYTSAASVTLAPGMIFPAVVGAYGSVLQGGTLRRGDTITL